MGRPRVLLPFRFPGGKFYALGRLRPLWEAVSHDEYREPFAGGAAVFFAKPTVQWNWLNDIDEDLMNSYRIMADPVLRMNLVDMVKKEIASKERWHEVRDMRTHSDLERAFKYYYLNRTSFSGKLSSPAWGYRPKRSLPPDRWQERIIPCGEKLEGVEFTSLDFADVIEAPARGSQVLLYLDPPYYQPPKLKHYTSGLGIRDHERLCEMLRSTSHRFLLTYDDTAEVREMYSWANVQTLSFYYRVDNSQVQGGKRRVGRELVVTNYKMPRGTKIEEFAS